MSDIKQNNPLTNRQKLYLHYMALGLTDREIARRMHVAHSTVCASYKYHVAEKTGLYTKNEIVAYARQHGYGEEYTRI